MMIKSIERQVELYCPACGGTQFASDVAEDELKDAPDEIALSCATCGHVLTKGELVEVNEDVIEGNAQEVAAEAIAEFEKALKKALR